MQTWRGLITTEMSQHGEEWEDVVACTLDDAGLDREFDAYSHRSRCGEPFTLWTARRVYFPVVYDNAEDVASVARHPDGVPTEHVSA